MAGCQVVDGVRKKIEERLIAAEEQLAYTKTNREETVAAVLQEKVMELSWVLKILELESQKFK